MKTVVFELFLTNEKQTQERCKSEIKWLFGSNLKSLIDIRDSEDSMDSYKLKLRISESKIWDTARKLMLVEGVLDVDPDLNTSLDKKYRKLFFLTHDEAQNNENRPEPNWYHKNVRLDEALAFAQSEFKAGRGCFDNATTKISVAQFDTGYTNHPGIKNVDKLAGFNYVASWYRRIFYSNWHRDARDRLRNLRPFLWASHGTSTASTIIGNRLEDSSVITGELKDRTEGLLPTNIDLIPFRISENIISFDNKMIHAVDQVVQNGRIPVITMSHASLFRKQSWKHAVEKAYEKGIIWVAAGGSHAPEKLRKVLVFPAKFNETVATAASTRDNEPWERTHYGDEIDICAPGFDIYVPSSRRRWYGLLPNRYSYKWSEGTSFSTPVTAAAAALWLAHHGEDRLNKMYGEPWQRVEAFRKVLKLSARPHKPNVPPDKYGAGLIDFEALLKHPLPGAGELVRAPKRSEMLRFLKTREEKERFITHKELVYLTACGKFYNHDQPNNELYRYIFANASPTAREIIDQIICDFNQPEIENPKSEAIKAFVKKFLNTWS